MNFYAIFVISDVKDHLSIKIPIKQLREATVLHEELLKFNLKRVFEPVDELALSTTTNNTGLPTGKRVFDARDKIY